MMGISTELIFIFCCAHDETLDQNWLLTNNFMSHGYFYNVYDPLNNVDTMYLGQMSSDTVRLLLTANLPDLKIGLACFELKKEGVLSLHCYFKLHVFLGAILIPDSTSLSRTQWQINPLHFDAP
jgi:hypothetical protein